MSGQSINLLSGHHKCLWGTNEICRNESRTARGCAIILVDRKGQNERGIELVFDDPVQVDRYFRTWILTLSSPALKDICETVRLSTGDVGYIAVIKA